MWIPSGIGLFGIGRFSHTQVRISGAGDPSPFRRPGQVQPNEVSVYREQTLRTLQKIEKLRKTLENIDFHNFEVLTLPGTITKSTTGVPAAATSATDLGFNTTRTPTSLRSTEEVNATPTSFSPFGPTFVGSTAQPTIGGAYLGTYGTGTLTFVVDRGGTHGQDDLKIKVYNPDDSFLQDINIKKEDLIDQPYTLLNGLTLTLGAGSLLVNDTFTVDVESSLPTSYTPTQPVFTGSTAEATINGAYDGSNGTGTMKFIVDREGTHGQDDLKIKVYNPDDSFLQDINIKKEDLIDQPYTLDNGLVLTLGAGDLLKGTHFTVDVNATVGSTVELDKSFDGVRNDNPNLQDGFSVTDGSFQLNGVTINVNASDTINMVLDRITQSSAGVTATFDAATETVLLTQGTPGAAYDIVLQNDTSGFLAAMKLDTATPTQGENEDVQKTLATVPRFASVTSGTIHINGIAISIDVNADSLTDVLDRINASEAGVTASLDTAGQRVSLVSTDANQQLILNSGGTGFFAALEITDGTHEPTLGQTSRAYQRKVGVSQSNARQITVDVNNFARAVNELFSDPKFDPPPGLILTQLRNDVQNLIAEHFKAAGPRFDTKVGLRFDFRYFKPQIIDFSQSVQDRFLSGLRTRAGAESIRDLFFGTDPSLQKGLVDRLQSFLEQSESDLKAQLKEIGSLIDVLV